MAIRTDLALEARDMLTQGGTELPGVKSEEREREGFGVTCVTILDRRGADAIGKPPGKYVTVELDSLMRREDNAFSRGAEAIAQELADMLPAGGCVLVAGLGNRLITPDSIGPNVVRWTMATRHLVHGLEETFGSLRPVAAISAGVLGDTGIESAEIIGSMCRSLHPDCVIAVDALAARSVKRLCRTVQISDTGIVPGSGVGNSRAGIDSKLTGCPVIAIGVPTVVDACTLARDMTGTDSRVEECLGEAKLIVTPREIDRQTADISRLVGYAIDLALQPSLDIADLDMLLG